MCECLEGVTVCMIDDYVMLGCLPLKLNRNVGFAIEFAEVVNYNTLKAIYQCCVFIRGG